MHRHACLRASLSVLQAAARCKVDNLSVSYTDALRLWIDWRQVPAAVAQNIDRLTRMREPGYPFLQLLTDAVASGKTLEEHIGECVLPSGALHGDALLVALESLGSCDACTQLFAMSATFFGQAVSAYRATLNTSDGNYIEGALLEKIVKESGMDVGLPRLLRPKARQEGGRGAATIEALALHVAEGVDAAYPHSLALLMVEQFYSLMTPEVRLVVNIYWLTPVPSAPALGKWVCK